MALTDVTNPVIINASLVKLVTPVDPFIRKVCFVSLGDTNILKNGYQKVDALTYLKYVTEDSITAFKMQDFFAYANDKNAYILELGAVKTTPIPNNYNSLHTYVDYFTWYDDKAYQTWAFVRPESDDVVTMDDYKNFYVAYNSLADWQTGGNADYEQYLTDNDLTDEINSIKQFIEQKNPGYQPDMAEWLMQNQPTFKAYVENVNTLLAYANTHDEFKPESYEKWLDDMGSYNGDFTEVLKNFNTFIQRGLERNYWYVLPDNLVGAENIHTSLFNNFTGTTAGTYFIVDLETTIDPTINPVMAKIKENKSVIACYDHGDGRSVAGALAGLFASYRFDISDTNPASPFNYKELAAFQYNLLEKSMYNSVINNSLNCVGTIANTTVLLNGRCMDTRAIDYWYQWDYLDYELQQALQNLIISGVNNPLQVIKYNQNGIDTIKATVQGVLDSAKYRNVITEYAESYNTATGEMVNTGKVSAIGFQTYIKNNPEDYQNEIYQGISFYVMIGRYIRQVVMNVTIG